MTSAPPDRQFRAVAVQPQWRAGDFLSAGRFRAWMRAQLLAAAPELRAGQPALVVLTELNGLPLVLRGGHLAALTGRFQWALGLLLLKHLPAALGVLARERVSPVRALQLALADDHAQLYLGVCRELAREFGVYLVCGSTPLPHYVRHGRHLRRDGSGLYNQTVILGPQGELIGTADKVYLTPDEQAGGVDLTPGRLEDLRVFPTPAGDLGVAISLDAFRPEVVGRLEALGCTVLLQPDANGSPWTGTEGLYPEGQTPRDQPLAWLESSWQVTATTRIPYAINPMVVGNLLDLTFDGQSAITGPAAQAPELRSYVLTGPRPGFLALLPWAEEGPPGVLREVGQQLAAGSGHPREGAYQTGVIAADLHLPPGRLTPPPPTAHEAALAALLSGEAAFRRRPGWLWPLGLALGAGLLLARGRRRRGALLAVLTAIVTG